MNITHIYTHEYHTHIHTWISHTYTHMNITDIHPMNITHMYTHKYHRYTPHEYHTYIHMNITHMNITHMQMHCFPVMGVAVSVVLLGLRSCSPCYPPQTELCKRWTVWSMDWQTSRCVYVTLLVWHVLVWCTVWSLVWHVLVWCTVWSLACAGLVFRFGVQCGVWFGMCWFGVQCGVWFCMCYFRCTVWSFVSACASLVFSVEWLVWQVQVVNSVKIRFWWRSSWHVICSIGIACVKGMEPIWHVRNEERRAQLSKKCIRQILTWNQPPSSIVAAPHQQWQIWRSRKPLIAASIFHKITGRKIPSGDFRGQNPLLPVFSVVLGIHGAQYLIRSSLLC